MRAPALALLALAACDAQAPAHLADADVVHVDGLGDVGSDDPDFGMFSAYEVVSTHAQGQEAAAELVTSILRGVPGYEEAPWVSPDTVWVRGRDCVGRDGVVRHNRIVVDGECKQGVTFATTRRIFLVVPTGGGSWSRAPFAHELGHLYQLEMGMGVDAGHTNRDVFDTMDYAQNDLASAGLTYHDHGP